MTIKTVLIGTVLIVKAWARSARLTVTHHLVNVELVAIQRVGGVLGLSGVRVVQSLERRAARERCAAVVLLLSQTTPV